MMLRFIVKSKDNQVLNSPRNNNKDEVTLRTSECISQGYHKKEEYGLQLETDITLAQNTLIHHKIDLSIDSSDNNSVPKIFEHHQHYPLLSIQAEEEIMPNSNNVQPCSFVTVNDSHNSFSPHLIHNNRVTSIEQQHQITRIASTGSHQTMMTRLPTQPHYQKILKHDIAYMDYSNIPPTAQDYKMYHEKMKLRTLIVEENDGTLSHETMKVLNKRGRGNRASSSNNNFTMNSFVGVMGTNFPCRLHDLLTLAEDDSSLSSVISWMPHGRSWIVHNKEAFIERISQSHFQFKKYESFLRQVNGWGFQRITKGPDENSYYHEMFLRGMPHLIRNNMRRCKRKKAVLGLGKCDEDGIKLDFYALNETHPIPNYYKDYDHKSKVHDKCTTEGCKDKDQPLDLDIDKRQLKRQRDSNLRGTTGNQIKKILRPVSPSTSTSSKSIIRRLSLRSLDEDFESGRTSIEDLSKAEIREASMFEVSLAHNVTTTSKDKVLLSKKPVHPLAQTEESTRGAIITNKQASTNTHNTESHFVPSELEFLHRIFQEEDDLTMFEDATNWSPIPYSNNGCNLNNSSMSTKKEKSSNHDNAKNKNDDDYDGDQVLNDFLSNMMSV